MGLTILDYVLGKVPCQALLLSGSVRLWLAGNDLRIRRVGGLTFSAIYKLLAYFTALIATQLKSTPPFAE